MTLVLALVAGTAFGQYPYIPPGWGYFNKAEAMQQQAWENQRWQREQAQRQMDYIWGEDSVTYGIKSTQLRLLKEQERAMRNHNRIIEQRNPFIDDNPFNR